MTLSSLIADKWSAISQLVMIARHYNVVALVKLGNSFKTARSFDISAKEIQELDKYEVLHVIVDGKTTRSTLTDEERKFFTEEARRMNAWLN